MHSTSRLGLNIPDAGDNESAYPPVSGQQMATLDNAVLVTEGTISARPLATAVEKDHIYRATDTAQWFISDGTNWNTLAVFGPGASVSRGAVNIATSQSSSSTSYTTLATPDQVTGIVLPTNGLIAVWYQAGWSESVLNAAQAAIFVGSNQLFVQTGGVAGSSAGSPFPQSAKIGGAISSNQSLYSFYGGLASHVGLAGYSQAGDVSTGQVVGFVGLNTSPAIMDLNSAGTEMLPPVGSGPQYGWPLGGPCYIFAAAGTYTISVQFKTSSGTVTASNRKLWVRAESFG